MKAIKDFGIYEQTEFEKELGFGPYKLWFRYGKRSPHILVARWRNAHQPVFRARMAWQRLTRRYDDSMLWNLNSTLAELIVQGTSGMRRWGHGYPSEFAEPEYGGDGGGWEEWEDILRRIEEGFQAYLDDNFHNDPTARKKFEEAQELLTKWFSGLWD